MKTIQKHQKVRPKEVKKIFNSIAPKYNLANRFISLNMDTKWRKKLVQWSEAPESGKVLDCATGTGVLAFEFQKKLGVKAKIIGVDFSEEMLSQAKKALKQKVDFSLKTKEKLRQKQSKNFKNIYFKLADIQKLPFPDDTFDVSSIAYGLRNTEEPLKTLQEMARVTKKGGTVIILETGDKHAIFLKPFFYLYFRYVVPFLGGRITGEKAAYQYLQKTSMNFPSRNFLLKLMEDTKCFNKLEYKTLFFGASFIYKARVCT